MGIRRSLRPVLCAGLLRVVALRLGLGARRSCCTARIAPVTGSAPTSSMPLFIRLVLDQVSKRTYASGVGWPVANPRRRRQGWWQRHDVPAEGS